jgi:YfiR/HmsC-like
MRYLAYSIFLAAIGFCRPAIAQTTNHQAYALFVFNIAKYSEIPKPSSELHITIYGKSKVYDELLKQNGKNINGQVFRITQAESVADLAQSNVIFIPDGRSSSLDEVLKATEGKSVVIICEREGMFKKGAGFSFIVTENNALRFDINSSALDKRQIKVSKTLSALAHSTI